MVRPCWSSCGLLESFTVVVASSWPRAILLPLIILLLMIHSLIILLILTQIHTEQHCSHYILWQSLIAKQSSFPSFWVHGLSNADDDGQKQTPQSGVQLESVKKHSVTIELHVVCLLRASTQIRFVWEEVTSCVFLPRQWVTGWFVG